MTAKEFFQKVDEILDKIGEFFKKIWWVIFIPIGAFILTILGKKVKSQDQSDIKEEVKDLEKEIDQKTEEIEKQTEKVEEAEKQVEKDIKEIEECIDKTTEKKEKEETQISDLLPGLKK